MNTSESFSGVKIALVHNDSLVMIQRDDKPGLSFAGLWDFPGGAREEDETPIECVTREVEEELGITLDQTSIVFERTFPAMNHPEQTAYFMVAMITDDEIDAIEFGDEGQGWKLMTISEFFEGNVVVPDLKSRFQTYLDLE